MSKKIDDETLADVSAEPVTDEALSEAPVEAEQPEQLAPEDFDLAEWLDGLAPESARYPLPGGRYLALRARTADWLTEWSAATEGMDEGERDLDFLAAHVADERVTRDHLVKLRDRYPADFRNARNLARTVDTEPSALIPPAFLPAASD